MSTKPEHSLRSSTNGLRDMTFIDMMKLSAVDRVYLYDAPDYHVIAYYDKLRLEQLEQQARAKFFTIH